MMISEKPVKALDVNARSYHNRGEISSLLAQATHIAENMNH